MSKHPVEIILLLASTLVVIFFTALYFIDVETDNRPKVHGTGICPDGSPVVVYVPVDCLETCDISQPAESMRNIQVE